MTSAVTYEVQTHTVCDGWINCWAIDGEPMTFGTIEEAQEEIEEFIRDLAEMSHEMGARFSEEAERENFRIVLINSAQE